MLDLHLIQVPITEARIYIVKVHVNMSTFNYLLGLRHLLQSCDLTIDSSHEGPFRRDY